MLKAIVEGYYRVYAVLVLEYEQRPQVAVSRSPTLRSQMYDISHYSCFIPLPIYLRLLNPSLFFLRTLLKIKIPDTAPSLQL